MTLIAFNTTATRADIITDTWSYADDARTLGRTSKVNPIQHLDAVTATQGNTLFGDTWLHALGTIASRVDFDGLVSQAPSTLREWVWDSLPESHRSPSQAFLIGYSDRAARFRAYRFASEEGFAAEPIDEPFIHPTPFSLKPDEREVELIRTGWTGEGAVLAAFLSQWRARPALTAPTSQAGWLALAELAREQRAMADIRTGMKVLVGGDVFLSTVRRGEFTSRRVHRFNDTGAELDQILAGTQHPLGLAGPCPCGSGERYSDCSHQRAVVPA